MRQSRRRQRGRSCCWLDWLRPRGYLRGCCPASSLVRCKPPGSTQTWSKCMYLGKYPFYWPLVRTHIAR